MTDKKKSEIIGGILDPSFGKSQEGKAQKKREKLGKAVGEAYETLGETIGEGVEAVSDFFTPSKEQKQNTIDYLRRTGNVERADKMQAQLDKESVAEEPAIEQPAVEESAIEKPEIPGPVGIGPTPDRVYEPTKELPVTEEEIEQNPSMKQSADAVDTIRSVSLEGLTELENTDRQTRDEYLNELAEAKEMYARTKDEIAQKKIWEALLNGFAALATAWYGNNTGLDLSGVKFSPSDWDSKLEEARDELAVAKSFAKDVRDVKLEGTEGERTRIIREMQGNKAFNEALTDKLRYEILTKQKAAMDATENSLSALEQQKKVFDQVKGTPQYQVYAENKKALEKTLSDYKEDPSDDKLEELRIRSNSLDTAAKSITSRYNVDFPNEYPPYIFEDKDVTRLIIFPGKESPKYLDILAGKSQAGKYSNISPAVRKLYQTYLDNPEDKARGDVEDFFMKRYGIDITKGGL